MASICNDPNGRRRIQFFDSNGKRKTIRLGKVSQRQALAFKVKLEDLVGAKNLGHVPSDETSLWLSALDDETYEKLHRAGLVSRRGSATLGEFTRTYIDGRHDIKPSSRINMDRARSYLLEHFDADTPLRDISEGDAEDFQQHMVKSGRADNTIRKAVGRIRQFFNAAIRRDLVRSNPFKILPASVKANHERFFFVTREMIDRILEHCPDQQWRLIVVLARYGGLRCPSEVLALQWSDINWEDNRLRVPSPKTERHVGGASRTIPLFPELRSELLDAFGVAEEGTEHIITRYRGSNTNLRTQFQKIIKRAGYEPWPKLFQNLRSTRETELAETFPLHVVTAWIGNSELVAAKHYLQLTDEHFLRATSEKAAQNAAQKLHEASGNESNAEPDEVTEVPTNSDHCNNLPVIANYFTGGKVPEVGLEPTRSCDQGILNPSRLPIPPHRLSCESLEASGTARNHRGRGAASAARRARKKGPHRGDGGELSDDANTFLGKSLTRLSDFVIDPNGRSILHNLRQHSGQHSGHPIWATRASRHSGWQPYGSPEVPGHVTGQFTK